MWIINNDTNKWTPNTEKLTVSDYESLKQELKNLRFYQRVLSAATFVRIDDINNIYDVISNRTPKTFNYISGHSPYITPYFNAVENEYLISSSQSLYEFKEKILPEYGLTLKNLFTPKRLIDDQAENILYVDVATNDIIFDITNKKPGITIDGVLLKNGHRVLVKNQYSLITISSSIDPKTYFDGNYQVFEEVGTDTTYLVYNSQNGIYVYDKDRLVRSTDLDKYENLIKYSVVVKLGIVNRETQWSLQRLSNGLFPEYLSGESIYFLQKQNYILRNRMDYNNLFELVLYDTIKHGTQSFTVDNMTYTIPQRTITVGEFGVIINHQEDSTNIINCKYKVNLRCISETTKYYWICGDDGNLLKVDKLSLNIEKVKLLEKLADPNPGIPKDPKIYKESGTVLTQLNSVSFFNDIRGAVVGKFNQIWVTSDSGQNWSRINILDFDGYNYNVVIYTSINKFFVGGDNGVFLEFIYEFGNWTAIKRRVSKFLDSDDEYLLVDDITDLKYFNYSKQPYLTATSSFIAISAKNDNLCIYDINNSVSDYSFIYLGNPTFSDISSIDYSYTDSKLYISSFENIYTVEPLQGTFSATESNVMLATYSNFYTQSGINSLYIYNNTDVLFTGNNTLWKIYASATFSDVYDNTFLTELKPKLLFLDYDAGSRLYWFDDYGQYRLPNRYLVPVSYLIDSSAVTETHISFTKNTSQVYDKVTNSTFSYFENNWITYWKDRLKTFEYYSHIGDGFKVEPSFNFKSSDFLSGIFTYSSADVSIDFNDFGGLMPSTTSRFRSGASTISSPVSYFPLYFHKFLGIWAITLGSTHSAPEKGDVINIDCEVFSGNFIINKVYSETSGLNTIYFQYFFTEFNKNIINNLNNLSGEIKIRNLNRYPTKTGGVKSFTATYSVGYVPGSYVKVDSISNTGGLSTFDIEINGAKNVSSITVNESGYGFSVGDTIIIPNTGIVGGASDIELTVTELDYSSLFIENFKKHYISKGYDIEVISKNYLKPDIAPVGVTQSFQITGKYSQFSAYYNLQTNVEVLNTSGYLLEEEILYQNGFLNFGYTPTYNLLSYLNYIDPFRYIPTKEFLALPKYDDIPGPDSGIPDTNITNDNILYVNFISGTYSGQLESNKLYFGVNLKNIWDSFLLWTFVDVIIKQGDTYPPVNGGTVFNTQRLIIIDKFYDDKTFTEPYYVLVFHDKFTGTNTVSAISIHSRRTLQQISDDLQYINRLQRPYEDADGLKWSEKTIEPGFSYTNYETDINFKIPTDSYTKVLLSDSQIIEDLSAIIYTDYKYELAVQVINLENRIELPVSAVLASVNSKYQLSFNTFHGLKDGDGVVISLASGTYSNWPSLLGYHVINYLDGSAFEIDIPFTGFLPADNLKISYTKKDPFLNFEPVDIFDLGISDREVKQSIKILPENYEVIASKYYLKNVDPKKYRFRLIDGLDLVKLTEDFYWILDAEVTDAIIGMDSNQNLVWYTGVWEGGRWFGGTWISGTWKSGDWYDGVWTSKMITDNLLRVKVDNALTNQYNSVWYTGRWFGGKWENGTWYAGRWYGGNWENGRWFDGTWNDGTWYNGVFSGGIWVLGTWYSGQFNTDSSLSYWLDGKFLGGDFENGIWYNGEFNETGSIKSRFGTKSFSTRNSTWYGGKFIKGEFHSFLNTNDKGLPDVSEIHKYSNWHSGIFSGGVFYGGNVHNIKFSSSLWQGGILNDIDIIQIKSNSEYNHFVLDGIYRFNIKDTFYVVDNFSGSTYSIFGSTKNPRKYVVLDTTINEESNTTEVFVDTQLNEILSVNTGIIDTGIKCVSSFENSTWNSGIWFNGVFKDGHFNGGMWYHGYFDGVWG